MSRSRPDRPLGVIILAAGRGTRMRSDRAKVLHTIAGKPFILSVLDTARSLAPDRVAVVVGHDPDEVRGRCATHLSDAQDAVPVTYPVQAEQRGTGDAVRAALPDFDGFSGDVLILYGDVPRLRVETLSSLLSRHRASRATLSLLTATFENPSGYGRIRRDPNGAVAGIVEERDLAPDEQDIKEINPGIYCVDADFLTRALARLRNDNAQREYYLTDIVGFAVSDGEEVVSVPIEDGSEVAGINSREDLAMLEERARRALTEKWMRAGVTVRDPATTYLEEDVTIGADTEIGPNTQIGGRTTIGRGCRIDGTAFLRDVTIGDRVHLRLGVVMNDCEVGDDVVIGPFAHLRPGSVLAAGVHIGNFVETKNARIGAGTKANHLTYLGDVEIGEQTNVGAGTITCNYDGFAKHRTVIGSRVQIGSDTQLVAPVRLADDVYVGAGTTVTGDVPAGNLVLSRSAQRNVPGWVARKRAKAAGKSVETAKKTAKVKTVAFGQSKARTTSRSVPRGRTQTGRGKR